MNSHARNLKPARILALILSAAVFCIPSFSTHGRTLPETRCEKEVLALVHKIDAERDETAQVFLAQDLAYRSYENRDCKTRRVIRALTALLQNQNDGVRWGAAEALADVGPAAKSAVPALERALRQSDAELAKLGGGFLPTRYSGQAVRVALRKISGRIVPDYNEQH